MMICHALLPCIVVGALACRASGSGSGGTSGTSGSHATQEPRDVSDELRQLTSHPDLEVVIRTGLQHWRAGEITLAVRGNGAATVTQRLATGDTSFTATLDKDEVDALGRDLDAHRFTAARTSKLPRKPGDTPVRFVLQRGDHRAFEAQIWNADRFDDADLDAILSAGQRLVWRVSNGAIGGP